MTNQEIAVQTAARRRGVSPAVAAALIDELESMGFSLVPTPRNIPIDACGASDVGLKRFGLGGK